MGLEGAFTCKGDHFSVLIVEQGSRSACIKIRISVLSLFSTD